MNVAYHYNDITSKVVENQQACADFCALMHLDGLPAFFWEFQIDSKICYVKDSDAGRVGQQNRVSGNRYCGETPTTTTSTATQPGNLIHSYAGV